MPRSGRRKRLKSHPCPYCPSSFSSEEGVNRHIGHSAECSIRQRQAAVALTSSAPQQDHDDPEGYESDISDTYRKLYFLEGDELDAYLDSHEPLPPILTENVLKPDDSDEPHCDLELPDIDENEDDLETGGPTTASSPKALGPYIEVFTEAGKVLRREQTKFERRSDSEKEFGRDGNPWSTLHDRHHFELAEWLLRSGLSRAKMDEFLKLDIVSLTFTVTLVNLIHFPDTQS